MPSSTSDDRWLPNTNPSVTSTTVFGTSIVFKPSSKARSVSIVCSAVSDAVGRHPFGLHLQGGSAKFQRGSERLVGALAGDQVIELERIAALHRDRFGQ